MIDVTEEEFSEDHPIKEGLKKLKEVMQELRTKIVDLEARVVPTTPPKELARREEEVTQAISNLIAYEVEYLETYTQVV